MIGRGSTGTPVVPAIQRRQQAYQVVAETAGPDRRHRRRLRDLFARISVNGADHDLFFVTTTYGKTLAIDAKDGSTLWTFTPAGYTSWAGSAQITNATPVADPNRQFIYAASPDGHIQKITVANGHVAWSTAITRLSRREKIASALNYFRGRVIAVTGGYIGDAPPYQGHVVLLDASSGRLQHVWNYLCSNRQELIDRHSCGQSGPAIWARGGAVIDSTTGDIFLATGNGRWNRHSTSGILDISRLKSRH